MGQHHYGTPFYGQDQYKNAFSYGVAQIREHLIFGTTPKGMPSYRGVGPIREYLLILGRTITRTPSGVGQDDYGNAFLYGIGPHRITLLYRVATTRPSSYMGQHRYKNAFLNRICPLRKHHVIWGRTVTRTHAYIRQDHYENAFLYGIGPLRERITIWGSNISQTPSGVLEPLRKRLLIWGSTITITPCYMG